MLKQILQLSTVALLVLLIALQFIRPAKTNPVSEPALDLKAHAAAPAEIQAIFERACRDCHSNQTDWPWYSHVAPVSWLVADDVRLGRQQLNFSDWGKYSARQAENKLEEICGVVQAGAMPPRTYLVMHPQAKLSEAHVNALCTWTKTEQQRLTAQARP
jgi:cytochrome c551/c552